MKKNDFVANFIALIILTFLSFNAFAVGNQNIGMPANTTLINGELHYQFRNQTPSRIYPDLDKKFNSNKTFDIGTSRGRIPVTISQKTPLNLLKIGKAATNLLKRLGPIAYAGAGIGLICDLSNICLKSGSTTELEITRTNSIWDTNGYRAGSPQLSCKAYLDYVNVNQNPSITYSGVVFLSSTYFNCQGNNAVFGSDHRRDYAATVVVSQQTGRFPVTPADIDDAEPKLNDPRLVRDIINSDEPIAVNIPETIPKSVPISSETEITRDSSGTATGTKTTNRTAIVEGTSFPDIVRVSEKTIITTTNITNNTTNTTTIDDVPPPESPPSNNEDTKIEFDNVTNNELPIYSSPSQFTTQSWGEASCPPDPSFTTSVGSYTLPFHLACDFATALRNIILIMSALSAAFIVTGVRKNGVD